jgi:hypothetical protein
MFFATASLFAAKPTLNVWIRFCNKNRSLPQFKNLTLVNRTKAIAKLYRASKKVSK